MTQRAPARETIPLEKFAKYVAGKVLKFMEVNPGPASKRSRVRGN